MEIFMNRRNLAIALALSIVMVVPTFAQENYKKISEKSDKEYYNGGTPYETIKVEKTKFAKKPKNVILMIGDGMGLAQMYSGFVANGGHLNLMNFKCLGLATTYSGSSIITDSAAGGTALSTGKKTYNGAIGMDMEKKPIENIREKCEKKGFATGVISTCAVTHATPASFVAHQPDRSMYEAIAADFLKTDIDVFIGGGYKHFAARADSTNLIPMLKEKGYQVLTDMKAVANVTSGKLAGLVAPEHIQQMTQGRGDMLPVATKTAINILKKDEDGFFLMVEGSAIDWGGHANDATYVVTEMMDFDRAIGEAIKFAIKDKETLIIVTADHETGGMSFNGGDYKTGKVKTKFTTGDHTGLMVPVYAFGPGAENFQGFIDNTDIPNRIAEILGK